MPFRDYTGFDLETMRIMNRAYDAAFARLALDTSNPATSTLAAMIVKMVKDGEREPATLCDRAVSHFKK